MRTNNLIKIVVTVIAFCIKIECISAQTPGFSWAKSAGGDYFDGSNNVVTDSRGNVYVCGGFGSSSITFGNLPTMYNTSNSANWDLFMVKYDPQGNALWSKKIGCSGMAIDANDNIFITGNFNDSSKVLGQFTLQNPSAPYSSLSYIAKCDTAGNVVSVSTFGGLAFYISIKNNAIAIGGVFNDSSITIGNNTLVNNGAFDIYTAKFDTMLNVIWAKCNGSNENDILNGVGINNLGEVFSSGYFDGQTIVLGQDTLQNPNSNNFQHNCFITKYDTTGVIAWAKATGLAHNSSGESLTIDNNNIYISGIYNGSQICIGADTLVHSNTVTNKSFIVKFNTNGNFVWGNVYAANAKISFESDSFLYVYGEYINDNTAFGNTVLHNSDSTMSQMFIAKLDTLGNAIWATNTKGNKWDSFGGIALDNHKNLYLVGGFQSSHLNFGSILLINTDTINSYSDFFIAKIDSSSNFTTVNSTTLAIPKEEGTTKLKLYPNPAKDELFVEVSRFYVQSSKLSITDVLGNEVIGMENGKWITEKEIMNYQLSIINLERGIYFVRCGNETVKFVKE